jgi:hypothetical protein
MTSVQAKSWCNGGWSCTSSTTAINKLFKKQIIVLCSHFLSLTDVPLGTVLILRTRLMPLASVYSSTKNLMTIS